MWQEIRQPMPVTEPRAWAAYKRFQLRLETDFAKAHKVQHYALALGMGEKNLSRVCLATMGVSAKACINQRLVLEAKRLLAHTKRPVQAIGHALGFEDATNFVKFFRKETGLTPGGFRQTNA
jgi:AraC-like DNA-binding protein